MRFKYNGTWFDAQGTVVTSGTVTVYLAGTTTPAIIYSASSGGSAISNSQVTTNSDNGSFEFWVDDADYASTQNFRIIGTKSSFKNLDLDDIGIISLNRETALTLLVSKSSVDMKTVGSTTLFTIPTGKVGYISQVVIRDPSASMAGGTDYDFTQWKQAVDLSSLTTLNTDYIFLDGNNTKYQELAAGTNFQITVNTGTTAACTATIDAFGYFV